MQESSTSSSSTAVERGRSIGLARLQETGRAGRDGADADCYLFYTYGDRSKLDAMICKGEGDEQTKAMQRQQLLQVEHHGHLDPPVESVSYDLMLLHP